MSFQRRRRPSGLASLAATIGGCALVGLAAVVPGFGPMSVRAETAPTSVTYTTDGEHQFVVPAGVTSIHVVAIGMSGQPGSGIDPGSGGDGANASADVAVTPGASVYAEVNIGGAIGGHGTDTFSPPPTGGSGGGESDLRTCSTSTCVPSASADPRLLVAGGGGGGAPGSVETVRAITPSDSSGGAAGAGTAACDSAHPGTRGVDSTTSDQGHAGSCLSGGHGGSSGSSSGHGQAGGLVIGGAGGSNASFGGGGGGAGFYGGGGGAADSDDGSSLASGAGGGGSSCAPCAHTPPPAASTTNPVSNGAITAAGGAAASVTISWSAPATPTPTATPTATASPTGGVAAVTSPGTPSTGAGTLSNAWPLVIAGSGVLLFGLGLLTRRRRDDTVEAP